MDRALWFSAPHLQYLGLQPSRVDRPLCLGPRRRSAPFVCLRAKILERLAWDLSPHTRTTCKGLETPAFAQTCETCETWPELVLKLVGICVKLVKLVKLGRKISKVYFSSKFHEFHEFHANTNEFQDELWPSFTSFTCRGCFGRQTQPCFTPVPAHPQTVEALNIASATEAHVDTISVASPAACGPLSPSYNVEAKRVTLLPRPNRLQVQHCIRGRGPQISCHSSSLSGPCPLVFCSALAIFRASTVSRRPSVVFGPAPSLRTVCLSAREDFGETCLGPQPTHAYNLQGFGDACLRADM